MYVKLLYGPNLGEVTFMRNDVARALIASGRAVSADPEVAPAVVVTEEKEVVKPRKKER